MSYGSGGCWVIMSVCLGEPLFICEEMYSAELVVGVGSMYPLLKKDGLGLQYMTLAFMWNWAVGFRLPQLKPFTFVGGFSSVSSSLFSTYLSPSPYHLHYQVIYTAIAIIHLLTIFVLPPSHLPDLYAVLNVLVSASVFGMIYLWSVKRGVEVGWALGGLGSSSASGEKRVNGVLKQN